MESLTRRGRCAESLSFTDLPAAVTQNTEQPPQTSPCQACGARCAFSRDWPRFTTESDGELERIPAALMDDSLGRMRCVGERCAALVGDVGVATSCSIYDIRPEVCRACEPGDDACRMARQRFGLD